MKNEQQSNFGFSDRQVQRFLELVASMDAAATSRKEAWRQCRRYGFQVWDRQSGSGYTTANTVFMPQQNSIAAQCAWRAAAYLHANTIGIGQTFFRLDVDDELRRALGGVEASEVRELRDRTLPLMRELSGTNFSSRVLGGLHVGCVLGTAVGYVEFNEKTRRLEFSYFQVGNGCFLLSNSRGRPDTFCRKFSLSPRQAVERYGEAVGPQVLEMLQRTEATSQQVEYVWLVYPRCELGEQVLKSSKDYPVVPSTKKAFGHVVIDTMHKRVVEVSGYDSFPFGVFKWGDLQDSVYGWSPIEMSLPDIKRLGKLHYNLTELLDRQVDPAMIVPFSWDNFSTAPGSKNYVDGTGVIRDAYSIISPPGATPEQSIRYEIEQIVQRIRNNCFLDAFETFDADSQTMSATEARGRVAQTTRAIAAIAEQVHTDYLGVLIQRSLDLLIEHGVMEKLPEAIDRKRVQVKYVSVLSSMVLDSENNKLRNYFTNVLEMMNARAQMGPHFDVYFNVGKIFEHMSDFHSVPQDILWTESERAEKQAALIEQQQAAMEQEQQNAMMQGVDLQRRSEPGSVASQMGM